MGYRSIETVSLSLSCPLMGAGDPDCRPAADHGVLMIGHPMW